MNKFIKGYEIYLSSNGVILIEDLLDTSLSEISTTTLGFKSLIVMLCGCLWEKNRLTMEQTANLFDELLDSKEYNISNIRDIIKEEMGKWSNKFKKDEQNNDKKKST